MDVFDHDYLLKNYSMKLNTTELDYDNIIPRAKQGGWVGHPLPPSVKVLKEIWPYNGHCLISTDM